MHPNLKIRTASPKDRGWMNPILDSLVQDTGAKVVFLMGNNGDILASSGELDETEKNLTRDNIIANQGSLEKFGKTCAILRDKGHDSIHIQVVGMRFILIVFFDDRERIALIREKSSEASAKLEEAVRRFYPDPDGGGHDDEGGGGTGGGNNADAALHTEDTVPLNGKIH
jgi:hypothetical protein